MRTCTVEYIPHWRPRSRHTRPATMNIVPGISKWESFCLRLKEPMAATCGVCTKKIQMRIVHAPMGRFIPKHHLQVAFSVNAPPMNGPAIAATPNTADIIPRCIGLRSSGIILLTIRSPPEKMPEAPKPAIARPRIKASEFGAVVQISDPVSNRMIAPT
jgi:hypothetical protein